MHDAMRRREVHREETPMIERDALLSRDVLYHRDSHNHRYTSLQPRNYYGPNAGYSVILLHYTRLSISEKRCRSNAKCKLHYLLTQMGSGMH